MEEIILRSFNCPEYTFRVVERVPNNYFVWNVSQIEETGCYIPFAKNIRVIRMKRRDHSDRS